MACLALSLQPANGPDNILLQTREWFPVSRALAAIAAFRSARLSSSPDPSAAADSLLGDDPLAAASGQLVVGLESRYRVLYRLVNTVYVLAVTVPDSPASDFACAAAVNAAVAIVVAACRGVDVTPEKIHRKYPEVYLSFDLVFRGGIGAARLAAILASIHGDNLSRLVAADAAAEARARGAEVAEAGFLDRRAAVESYSSASFELPSETLAAGDEVAALIAPPQTVVDEQLATEDGGSEQKDPFAASDMINKPEEALVGGFKKSKDLALVTQSDAAAALAGLEVTALPPSQATKPTFIGVEGFEGEYGGIASGAEETSSLSETFEGFNAAFGGGLDASEFVNVKKTVPRDPVTGLELLATAGGSMTAAAGAAKSPLDGLVVSKSAEMTAPEMYIVEEISAEFRESLLARVGLKGTVYLRTLPPKTAAGKEAEFSFRLDGTSGMKRAALQSSVVNSIEGGLFHVRTAAKAEPIPIINYSFLPRHSPLPLRIRLVKRHSGTLLSVMIQYVSNPVLPAPLSNVTFIVKLPVDPTLLTVSPKAILNRAEKELRWHIAEIPLKGPTGQLKARMPVDQDSENGELEVVATVAFAYQGSFTLSGVSIKPVPEGLAQFNIVDHAYASGSYFCV